MSVAPVALVDGLHALEALRINPDGMFFVQVADFRAIAVTQDPFLVALQGVEQLLVLLLPPIRRALVMAIPNLRRGK